MLNRSCPRPPNSARIGRWGQGLPRRYWRTFPGKFSRAGEIVEIMRGTLPLQSGWPQASARPVAGLLQPASSHCIPLGHLGACNGRPSPLSTAKQAKQTELCGRPCSCSSCRGRHWPGCVPGLVSCRGNTASPCLFRIDRVGPGQVWLPPSRAAQILTT